MCDIEKRSFFYALGIKTPREYLPPPGPTTISVETVPLSQVPPQWVWGKFLSPKVSRAPLQSIPSSRSGHIWFLSLRVSSGSHVSWIIRCVFSVCILPCSLMLPETFSYCRTCQQFASLHGYHTSGKHSPVVDVLVACILACYEFSYRNIHEQLFVPTYVFIFLGYILTSGISGSYIKYMFYFIRNFQTIFHMTMQFYVPSSCECMRIPLASQWG